MARHRGGDFLGLDATALHRLLDRLDDGARDALRGQYTAVFDAMLLRGGPAVRGNRLTGFARQEQHAMTLRIEALRGQHSARGSALRRCKLGERGLGDEPNRAGISGRDDHGQECYPD